MFTGIVTNLGIVESLKRNSKKDLLLEISTKKTAARKLEIGCSIACNGICLTLVSKKKVGVKNIFAFQASAETLSKTNLKNWQIGDLVNLEFSLRMGDEMGGHIVSGHIDGCAKISKIEPIQDSHRFTFTAEKDLLRFIAKKGSVTLDGVSLTVNEVTKNSFDVNLIEHTIKNTRFQAAQVGDLVNLEIDLLARYLERMAALPKRQ